MGSKSTIEWTDSTWNPTRGCSVISPGCNNCYAMGIAARFSGPGLAYDGFAKFSEKRRLPQWTGRVDLVADKLDLPLRWRAPRKIFVNSTSDLFHEELSNEAIAAVFGVMAAAPRHTFQILTKRAERMRAWFGWVDQEARLVAPAAPDDPWWRVLACAERAPFRGVSSPKAPFGGATWPLANVVLGVSVENQEYADARIPHLLETPAATRFVSYEPALGPVDFWAFLRSPARDESLSALRSPALPGLDWIVVGGESSKGARPFAVEWARDVIAQCHAARVPAFVKQLGAVTTWEGMSNPGEHWPLGTRVEENMTAAGQDGWRVRLRDSHGGDWSEWPEDLRVREFPEAAP